MKKVSPEKLKKIVKDSCSIADVCRALEISPRGGNYKTVKKLIKDLDTFHFNKGPWNKGRYIKTIEWQKSPIEEVLTENSCYTNSSKLRIRLIKEGLKQAKCEICGCTQSLELHHKNGDHTDNRLDNLQILCANCHRTTDNYRGKGKRSHKPASEWYITKEENEKRHQENLIKRRIPESQKKIHKRKEKICPICNKKFIPKSNTQKYCSKECYQSRDTKRPDIITLIQKFKEYKNFTKVAKEFNVTDNAVRKWCRLYKLPIHIKDLLKLLENIKTN